MRQPRKMQGAFQRDMTAWGDIITLDHMVDSGDGSFASSVTGDSVALVVKDVWSGLLHCFPCRSKSADDTYGSLLHFIGRRTVTQAYADNSPEIKFGMQGSSNSTRKFLARCTSNQQHRREDQSGCAGYDSYGFSPCGYPSVLLAVRGADSLLQ